MIKDFKGGHVEVMHGTHEQSEKYCSKDGYVVEEGTMPKQGKRTDLERAIACESVRELFENQTPNFQTIRVLEKHLEYCEKGETREVTIHYVDMEHFKMYPKIYMEDAYVLCDKWDGYDGQTRLITYDDVSYIPNPIRLGLPYRVKVGQTSRQVRITDIIKVET